MSVQSHVSRKWMESIRLQRLYLPLNEGEVVSNVVFSPEYPDTAVVIYENSPPRIFDLRLTGTAQAFRMAENGYESGEGWLDQNSQITTSRFSGNALHAAYRPSQAERPEELAIVFEGDENIYRLQPRFGTRMEPALCENVCRVAYDHEGGVLAAGGTDGGVTTFQLTQEVLEHYRVEVNGAIRALCVQGEAAIYVATELNSLFQCSLLDPNAEPFRRTLRPHGEEAIQGVKLNAIVWHPKSNIVACAGIGNDIFAVNPDSEEGSHCQITGPERIMSLQFVENRTQLQAYSDCGALLLPFSVNEERLPVFSDETMRVQYFSEHLQQQLPMVAAHQYGNLLCLVHAV